MTEFNSRRGQGRQGESSNPDTGRLCLFVLAKKGVRIQRDGTRCVLRATVSLPSLPVVYPPRCLSFLRLPPLESHPPSSAPVRAHVRGWRIVLAQPVPARLSRSSDRAYEKREGVLRRVSIWTGTERQEPEVLLGNVYPLSVKRKLIHRFEVLSVSSSVWWKDRWGGRKEILLCKVFLRSSSRLCHYWYLGTVHLGRLYICEKY